MIEFLIDKIHDPHFMTMLLAAIAASATAYTLVMPLFAGDGPYQAHEGGSQRARADPAA